MDIAEILKGYDLDNLTIGVLGGHSALDVCAGAKKLGFRTLAVCQEGRDKTYSQYYKTREGREGRGCVDEVILVKKFGDVVSAEVQEQLRARNVLFVHNRYFWVYCDFEKVEKEFRVPIIGSRELVKLEERDHPNNQYVLLEKAGIRIPKIVREGTKERRREGEKELREVLDRWFVIEKGGPLIVKANELERAYERDFFVINREQDYFDEVGKRVKEGSNTAENVANAVIEEFIIGAQVNLNFFYSAVRGELELMGTDMRRQTSLDGFLRLDSGTQLSLLNSGYKPSMVETGHVTVTMKESLVEKAFEIGEKFVKTMKEEVGGIVGPFALQGAVASEQGKEEFVIFDVSMRIPGSPGTRFTPYSGYLHGENLSYGERIAMEVKEAKEKGRLGEILS